MNSQYDGLWQRMDDLHANTVREVTNTGAPEALELQDMVKQLAADAENGMSANELSARTGELERQYEEIHQAKHSFDIGARPQPPYGSADDWQPHAAQSFYDLDYKNDWK